MTSRPIAISQQVPRDNEQPISNVNGVMIPALRVEHLAKVFRTDKGEIVKALDDFCFAFEPGLINVLLGASGAGKTTLLRLVAGLEKPTSGKIFLGNDITFLTPSERKVSMVFPTPSLLPHLNVSDNIGLIPKLQKKPRNIVEELVRTSSDQFSISHLLARYPAELSAGESQRVALARALIGKPSILLLDEPLSNLDSISRGELRRLLKSITNDSIVVYVTHDQQEALSLGDQLLFLSAGKLIEANPPALLYEEPFNLQTAKFVGSPLINILDVKVEEAGNEFIGKVANRIVFRRPRRDISLPAKVKAAFRPEWIKIMNDKANLEAVVIDSDYLGHEKHLYLKFDDLTLTARTDNQKQRPNGERLLFTIEKLLFFDPVSGKRIQ